MTLLDKVQSQTRKNCDPSESALSRMDPVIAQELAVTAQQRREKAIELSGEFMKAADRLPTLYSLGADWNRLIWELEKPSADTNAIEVQLHALAGDIRAKGYGLAVVVQGLDRLAERQELEAKQQQDEVARLASKAKATKARAQHLRDYALKCMDEIGEKRIETGVFTLSVRHNPPAVNVLDASLIPAEFMRTKIEVAPDLNAIKAHAKATGEVVPGTELVHSERLAIS